MNRHRPHLFVLPEDDANRQLANGFNDSIALECSSMRVLNPSGGWRKLLEEFVDTHVLEMRRFPSRLMVLLIDFDGEGDRMAEVQSSVPLDLRHRVFTLGVFSEPEDLKQGRSLGQIGFDLAEECRTGRANLWNDLLLRHNRPELDRILSPVMPILFGKVPV